MKIRNFVIAMLLGLVIGLGPLARAVLAQVIYCTATVTSAGITSSAYGTSNGQMTYNVNWYATFDCGAGANSACQVCTNATLSTSTSANGPWTSSTGYSTSPTTAQNCGVSGYTVQAISTASPIKPDTYYMITFSTAPVVLTTSNGGTTPTVACDGNAADYTTAGTVYCNGLITNPSNVNPVQG